MDDKILNVITNRWIKRSSALGKRLIKQQAKEALGISNPVQQRPQTPKPVKIEPVEVKEPIKPQENVVVKNVVDLTPEVESLRAQVAKYKEKKAELKRKLIIKKLYTKIYNQSVNEESSEEEESSDENADE